MARSKAGAQASSVCRMTPCLPQSQRLSYHPDALHRFAAPRYSRLAITDEASLFALRSTRHSSEDSTAPRCGLAGGATEQLPGRAAGSLAPADIPPPSRHGRQAPQRCPQEHRWVAQRAAAGRGGPGGADAGRAFVSVSTSSASGRRPVSGADVQSPRLSVHATGVQRPVPASERPGVRRPASGVRCVRPG